LIALILLWNDRLDAFGVWFGQTGMQKLQRLIVVTLTCVVILWGMRLISRAVHRSMEAALKRGSPDAMRRAQTLGSVVENSGRVLVVSFFVIEILQEFNVSVGPLIAGVGLLGAALGFGAQSIVKDVIGGFFLLVEDQFSVGDIVSLGDKHAGVVERMTLRMTLLRDMEGKAHYIPNGSISEVIVMSKEFGKALVDVEVSVDEDMDRVMEVLGDLGQALSRELPAVEEPTEVVGIESMNAVSCVIRTLTRTAPGQQWNVAREFRRRIIQRFREEGFARPMPQNVVWTRPLDAPPPGKQDS
jgi:small conductance mechanosensitive channel